MPGPCLNYLILLSFCVILLQFHFLRPHCNCDQTTKEKKKQYHQFKYGKLAWCLACLWPCNAIERETGSEFSVYIDKTEHMNWSTLSVCLQIKLKDM